MNEQKIIAVKKVGISGGNLSTNFKATFNLKVIDDITIEEKNELAMKSLVIMFQKIRDTETEEKIREMEKLGTVTKNASELMEKKARQPLTPERALSSIINSANEELIERAIKELQALKMRNGKK
jgi:hypothetical protein